MVERKLFKTKLCDLYQRGHCGRQTCSFAHGIAELRRYSGSFNGRRESRVGDLRDKLERRRSPLHRYSPGRDGRSRHAFHKNVHSPPRSLRKKRKNQHVDGRNDISESFRVLDGTEDRGRGGKHASSSSRGFLQEELKQVQDDVDVLHDQNCQLEVKLEERTQEADSLSSRIRDLDRQLSEEKDICKRITSKIKKFIRTHDQHTRLQDELKRSQVRLDKMVEEIGLDAAPLGASEEDSSINIVSDGEPNVNRLSSATELKRDAASPAKKQSQITLEASKSAHAAKELAVRAEANVRSTTYHLQSGDKEVEVGNKRKDIERNDDRLKRRKDASKNIVSGDKQLKGMDLNHAAPPTSMAAHAVDDSIELIEADERTEVVEKTECVETISTAIENGAARETAALLPPPPPLPPVSQNNYSQYKGDDENVDVDGAGEEQVEVDIV